MAASVIIETSEGAQYSVVEADFAKHYPDVKYKVLGDETPSAFIADVPRPAKRAGARRKTTKVSKPAVVQPVETPPE
jgi:hypothetical protein